MLDNLIIMGDHQRKVIPWEPDPPGVKNGLKEPPRGYFDEIVFEEGLEKRGGCFRDDNV